jgi:hypothetical protein
MYILWSFGIFFPFWHVVPKKIWHPWLHVDNYAQTFEVMCFAKKRKEENVADPANQFFPEPLSITSIFFKASLPTALI